MKAPRSAETPPVRYTLPDSEEEYEDDGGRERGTPVFQRYPAEFKREQIERILRGEVTAAELSRELEVRRMLIQRWKHLETKGGETAVGAETEHPVTAICQSLRIGRATAYREPARRPRHYACQDDRAFAAPIKSIVRERAGYGHRRITTMVNRCFGTAYDTEAPHSSLGMQSPREYPQHLAAAREEETDQITRCLTNREALQV